MKNSYKFHTSLATRAWITMSILIWCTQIAIGQVTITATLGSISGSTSTIAQAFDSINLGVYRGVITLQLTGNTTETVSAVLNASGTGSSSYTRINIVPTGGATRTISGNIAGPLIDLNGADSVLIDGLNTGGNALIISNSNASGIAIRLINDASQNSISRTTIRGTNNSTTSGVVLFATGTLTGNDNNVVSDNTFEDVSFVFPTNMIASIGTASAGVENSSNQLLNNRISNYYNATSPTNGVFLSTGNTDWQITGNRFYQTSARVYTATSAHRAIQITSGNGHTIENNIIGFSTASSTGTYALSSTASISFVGIDVTVGTTTATSIQNNRIQSISMTSGNTTSTGAGALCGIRTGGGNTLIGTISGNIIGDTVGVNSLSLTTSVSTGTIVGINLASAQNTEVRNNLLGGFTALGNSATIGSGVFGITVSATPTILNIINNIIGNNTPNNMVAGQLGVTTQGCLVAGISAPFATGAGVVASYSGNTIRNLSSYGTGTTGYCRGIMTNTTGTTGSYIVNGNTITNITSSGSLASVTSGLTAAVGIHFAYGLNPVISNNVISNITGLSTATTHVVVAGIALASATNITVSGNRIFGLSNSATGSTATTPPLAVGITIRSGTTAINIVNNMISLGVGQSGNTIFAGIQTNGGSTPNPETNIFNNTVHIGGTVTSGALPSFCYVRQDFALTSARTIVVNLKNNIFVNTRSGGTGKHYAISNNYNVTVSTTGWPTNASNFNILNSANSLTVGNWGGTTDLTFAGWRTAALSDTNSYSGISVNFVNPANDLHLNMGTTPTFMESNALTLSQVTTDFDGQARPGPVGSVNGGGFIYDFGADEFDGVPLDGSAPIVQVTPASNTTSLSNRSLPAFATILDVRVDTAVGTRPRIYYKKRSEANAFVGNTSTDNGWKFTEATNTSSPFSFSIDYSLLTNPVAVGDTIQYFVVAQDMLPLVAANPSTGFVGTAVGAITSAPSNPLSYIIVGLPLSGLQTVGVGQTFSTITQAVNNITLRGVSGPVTLQLKDVLYDSTFGEVFPIQCSFVAGSSATNTIRIVPDVGVSAVIAANFNGPVFEFTQGSNFIIEGRPGGTGGFVSGNNLIITNAHPSGNAIRFINDADSNTIYYTDLRGANTIAAGTANAGVVNFATTLGNIGNDRNIIRQCHIRESAFGTPAVAISAIGTGTSVSHNNEFNIIDSCEIYNFYHPINATAGIYIGANNGDWQINNNRFYQTVPRIYTTAVTHRVLWITPNTANLTSGSGFTIHNNFIGGSSGSGSGTYGLSGTAAFLFNVMDISVGLGTPTSIQGNTITQINDSSSSTSAIAFGGINLVNGNVNCGTTSGNLIGSRTVNGSITFTALSSSGGAIGIRTGGGTGNTFNIANNIISGFDLYGNSTTATPEFFGINLFTGTTINCSNNMIGDTTLPNSIQILSTSSTSTTAQRVSGIFINPSSGTPNFTVSNNLICNIRNSFASTGALNAATRGIFVNPTVNGTFTISNNRIQHISTQSQTTNGGAFCTLMGISVTHTIGNTTVSGNTIHSLTLSSPSTTAAVKATGIFSSTPASGSNSISRNLIHSITLSANNPLAAITGMDIASGNSITSNNIIRLGIDSSGSSINTACSIRGITKNAANAQIYFNTVYVGGSNVNNDVVRTVVFQRTATGNDDVRNNIFINTRTNASTGGGHLAVELSSVASLNMNNNLLRADTIGLLGATPYITLSSWKAASGVDANSINGIINFVNANGPADSVNLRINALLPTPIEAIGTTVAGVSTDVDFDGQIRASLTPVDIGADAGNFIASDLASPVIVYTPLASTTSTSSRVLSVSISDASGIYITGSLRPKIYYRKNSNAYVQDSGILVSGNSINSNWNFTINPAALGGVISADTIFYFVVAQDSSFNNNLGSEPGGAEGTNVNTITVFPTPDSYIITPIISGTLLVGASQPFTTLTGSSGAFNYINNAVVGGNLVIRITSDIEEPGTIALNEWVETGPGNYTLRIQPDTSILRNITGSVATAGSGLIRLSGASRVTINGSFLGSGHFLRFMNRPQSGVTLLFSNDAKRDTIRNCIVEGVNNTTGIILFGGSTKSGGTGNDSNAVLHCIIRDTLGTLPANNIPNTGISNSGTSGLENDAITIQNNEIYNFGFNAINLNATGTGNNWLISDNKIYQVISKNNAFQIVLIQGGSGHLISGNSIGGASITRSGVAFQTTSSLTGIILTAGVSSGLPITITNNTLSNLAATGTLALNAITVTGGNAVVTNNVIGGGMMPYDTLLNGQDNGAITINGGVSALVENNLIGNMSFYRNGLSRTSGITVSTTAASPITIRNNTIRDIFANSTGTTTSSFRPVGIAVTSAPSVGLTITRNSIRNIQQTNTGAVAYVVSGIMLNAGTSANIVVTQNRIRNIGAVGTGSGTTAPIVHGINVGTAQTAIVANNQISIGDSAFNRSIVYGISDFSAATNTYVYNSIFITGVNADTNNISSGFFRNTATSTINFRNNIVYNKRFPLVSSNNYAVTSVSTTGVNSNTINYNLLIVNDTARIAVIPTGTVNGWGALNNLFTTTFNTNWATTNTTVPAHMLFTDTASGDLSILTANPESWYANGKGIRVPNVSGDYNNNSGVRSTSLTTGSTDIGSVEFTPTVAPPIAFADKIPATNDSTQYFFASRLVGKAVWGSTGSLPTSTALQYYSGTNPGNTPVSSSFANVYFDFQQTGGSGYTYTLTLLHDSNTLGAITSLANLHIANYTGPSTNWFRYTTTTTNTISGLAQAPSVNGSGIFTFTDQSNNPLPVELLHFGAVAFGNDGWVDWATASEINHASFTLLRSTDGIHFVPVYRVKSTDQSTQTKRYQWIDKDILESHERVYYQLKQTDIDGIEAYSKVVKLERSNTADQSLAVFPNPFTSQTYLRIASSTEEQAKITISDISGQILATYTHQISPGINVLPLEILATKPQGIYLVTYEGMQQHTTYKLIKQ